MQSEELKPRSLFNPTLKDIETDFDKMGEHPQHFILEAGEIEEFPDHIAALLEKKLATRMLWENLPANRNKEKRYNELLKLIRVEQK